MIFPFFFNWVFSNLPSHSNLVASISEENKTLYQINFLLKRNENIKYTPILSRFPFIQTLEQMKIETDKTLGTLSITDQEFKFKIRFFNNGLFEEVNVYPPLTIDQFKKVKSVLQTLIFKIPQELGYTVPNQKMTPLQFSFKNDWTTKANLIGLINNQSFLFEGPLGMDFENAHTLGPMDEHGNSLFSEKVQRAVLAQREFYKSKKSETDFYKMANEFHFTSDQNLNLMEFNLSDPNATQAFELKGIRAPASIDEALLQINLIESLIQYARKSDPILLNPPSKFFTGKKRIFTISKNLRIYESIHFESKVNLVRKTKKFFKKLGLNWSEYAEIVQKSLRRSNLNFSGRCAGI